MSAFQGSIRQHLRNLAEECNNMADKSNDHVLTRAEVPYWEFISRELTKLVAEAEKRFRNLPNRQIPKE